MRRAAEEAVRLRRYQELRRAGRKVQEAQTEAGLSMPHATLYRHLARLREEGPGGLVDHRHPQPAKVTPEIRAFAEGLGAADRSLKAKEIAEAVSSCYGVSLGPRTISGVLKAAELARPVGLHRVSHDERGVGTEGAERRVRIEELGGAGLALLTVASELTGYGQGMATAIQEAAHRFKEATDTMEVDRTHRDKKGRFLSAYNLPRQRRDPDVGAVFDSVEMKRGGKDLAGMQIAATSLEILERKLLALMALPIITERGSFDGARDPR